MATFRHFSFLDKICIHFDQALRALTDNITTTGSSYPADSIDEAPLNEEARKHSSAFMRINHAGEICAQALYHGQAFVSKNPAVEAQLKQAALEEGDHLAWCKQRLEELNSHTSYLNPLWYAGSFCIGMAAGVVGDQWSLGFLAETEQQVIKHLSQHLQLLAPEDTRSYKILEKMTEDERKHRDEAIALGAKELPEVVKIGMAFTSKIMVKTAYYV